MATTDAAGGSDVLASSAQVDSIDRALGEELDAAARLEMAVLGDPIVVGLSNQVFKFLGESDRWYANLACPSLQWNMRFHQFVGLPVHEDMFITALGISLFDTKQQQPPSASNHAITIQVKDESTFFPGCGEGETVCLGKGSLEIVVNDQIIDRPGDYIFESPADGSKMRVIVYNTFAACSRKWLDYQEPEAVPEDGRALSPDTKRPIEFVFENRENTVDPQVCDAWVPERQEKHNLFLQDGSWTTMIVETPQVSFLVEYRQSYGRNTGVPSHSIDAWISKFSPSLEREDWQGILGETRYPLFNANGEQILSGRDELLRGKLDSDYEVDGPYGLDFAAKENNQDSGQVGQILQLARQHGEQEAKSFWPFRLQAFGSVHS